MRNLPSNDEEYNALLERIVKGAEYLENPLIKPDDYRKGMVLYDQLYESAIAYRAAKSNHETNRVRTLSA
ncbi:hypothetical protein PAECIP111893_02404 [Paenibacillus plantiphilus]|uniref:Uncharacterized protein n=1 Tax=Paenibacillus plantiphilus TaxID=2905650 RepID=A0ABM9C948_9BACL|nr:hypothetical protein PAECIP111893_02404 [Paenibacillus plantiphilus]